MKKRILALLEWYRKIASFGPSRMQMQQYVDRYPLSFSESDFFDKLYISTQLEKDLYKEVNELTHGNIIAICGPSGSGKSTVSLKVKRDIQDQLRTKLIYLDLRIEESSKTFDKISAIDDENIRELLLNQFEMEFPMLLTPEGNSDRVELYYFLLSPELRMMEYKKAQVFLPVQKYMRKTAHLFNISCSENQTFRDWFLDNTKNPDLIMLFSEVDEHIDISHYVAFIKYQDRYDSIIFWIDNIDSFTNIQQSQIVSILEKLQRNILNSTKIVIAVREENIYRTGKYTDNFNEPFISRVTFKNPDTDTASFTNYGAINVPVMAAEKLALLINKKLDFVFESYLTYGEKLQQMLEKINLAIANLPKTDDDDVRRKREGLLRERKRTQDDLAKFNSQKLSSKDFIVLKQVSGMVCECMEKEKVIFLANNSIKTFLKIHSEYLYYVIDSTAAISDQIDSSGYNISDLTTDFLSWIHSVNDDFGVETFNVVEELGKYQNSTESMGIGCFLPYLLLTRVWNQCIHFNGRPSPGNNPYVYEIIEDLCKDFNFPEYRVKQAFVDLYKQANGKGNFITFRSKKNIESPGDIELSTTVRITYRGRITIGHIINSFGYLKECTARLRRPTGTNLPLEKQVLQKISLISEVHLQSLLNIRENLYGNKKNWYLDYLMRYGIPLKPEFVRNSSIGRSLANIPYNRALYMETVFESLNSFFFYHERGKYKSQIVSISSQFNKHLESIISNTPVAKIKIKFT